MPKKKNRPGLPWEKKRSGGLWQRLLDTTKIVLLKPTSAFKAMNLKGGHLPPLAYCLGLGWLGYAASSLWSLAFSSVGLSSLEKLKNLNLPINLGQESGLLTNAVSTLLLLAVAPLLIAAVLYVSTAMSHLLLMVLRGAGAGFEATFRVAAYTMGATAVWSLLPFCGNLVGAIWWIVIAIIGFSRAHNITTGKAMIAVLTPLLLCLCLCCGFYGLIAAIGMGAAFNAIP